MQGLNPPSQKLAVAVSGGADSMALAHMLAQTGVEILALTVDHGLRADSATEAAQVSQTLSGWPNVTHRILRWEGAKPEGRIQESARDARYALMAQACFDAGITHLALAHHRDDQAETFLMRLSRGSGIDGLAAMRKMQIYNDHLTLWRPLLQTASHADLVTYCQTRNIAWVEDSSNANPRYARVRLRNALQNEGMTQQHFNTSLRRIERASDALRILSARLLEKAAREKTDDRWVLDLNLLKSEPFELSLRVIRAALAALGSAGDYGARFSRIEDMAQICLAATTATSMTLGGCIISVKPGKGTLAVTRENPRESAKSLPLAANGL